MKNRNLLLTILIIVLFFSIKFSIAQELLETEANTSSETLEVASEASPTITPDSSTENILDTIPEPTVDITTEASPTPLSTIQTATQEPEERPLTLAPPISCNGSLAVCGLNGQVPTCSNGEVPMCQNGMTICCNSTNGFNCIDISQNIPLCQTLAPTCVNPTKLVTVVNLDIGLTYFQLRGNDIISKIDPFNQDIFVGMSIARTFSIGKLEDNHPDGKEYINFIPDQVISGFIGKIPCALEKDGYVEPLTLPDGSNAIEYVSSITGLGCPNGQVACNEAGSCAPGGCCTDDQCLGEAQCIGSPSNPSQKTCTCGIDSKLCNNMCIGALEPCNASCTCPPNNVLCNGMCTAGNCCTSMDCSSGQICNSSTMLCGGCTSNSQCTEGNVGKCVSGICEYCQDGEKRCSGVCISGDSCCTNSECTNGSAGRCTSNMCEYCEEGGRRCSGVCITSSQCCTNSDCSNGVEGRCNSNMCEYCPDTWKRCSGVCISGDSCCTNSDCSNGVEGRCTSNMCEYCEDGGRRCFGQCITSNQCCTNSDCPSGQTCNSSTKTCQCPSGQRVCNGACISSFACCSNNDCPTNQTCTDNMCSEVVCGSSSKECNGMCILRDQCCSDTDCTNNLGCESTFHTCLEKLNFELRSSTFSPQIIKRGNIVNLDAEIFNIGSKSFNSTVSFTKPHSSWVFNDLSEPRACVDSGNRIDCMTNGLNPNQSRLYQISFTIPNNFSCNNNTNYTSQISASATDTSNQTSLTKNGASLITRVSCHCSSNSNCQSGTSCDLETNTCKSMFEFAFQPGYSRPNPASPNINIAFFQNHIKNIGTSSLNNLTVSFQKPHQSWILRNPSGTSWTHMEAQGQVNLTLSSLPPRELAEFSIELMVPEDFTCNDNMTYPWSVSAFADNTSTISGPPLGTSVSCSCSPGYVECNNMCVPGSCCTNSHCPVGQMCNTSTHQCQNISCPSGQKLCGNNCIANSACCSNDDCSTEQFCDNSSNSCKCTNNQKVCGSTCIANSACCTNTDCSNGKVCNTTTRACECPTGQKVCGSTCIANSACCTDTDCSDGKVCNTTTRACECPAGQKLCGNICIANSACCNNTDCSDGKICNISLRTCEIPCPSGQKRCASGGACIANSACCTDANCSSGQYCDTSTNSCKQIFDLNIITNTSASQTLSNGSVIEFGANPRNTGRDTLNNVVLTFPKPNNSWTYAGVASTNMANSCIENGNVINCTFTTVMAGVAPLAKIKFNIPYSSSCNDNMTYSTQITGMSNEVSLISGPTLSANISCSCTSGQIACNNMCVTGSCCMDSECQIGQRCNTSTYQCQAISCPSGQKLCGNTCIANSACCINTDCSDGKVCNTTTRACECPAGQKLCGNICIANSACCNNNDCSDGKICNISLRTCEIPCPSGQKRCAPGGACIANSACCTDANCSSGQYCDTSINTCKQIFGLNLITNTSSSQTVNNGSQIFFGANAQNTGRDTLNNVVLTFPKPNNSWTYAGVGTNNMATSCIENGNVINCTFTTVMAGTNPLAKIGFNVPYSFSCNDDMTYSTQITAMANEISSTSPLTLNANISCSCAADQKVCGNTCIANSACCTNTDCSDGKVCNSSSRTCECPAGQKPCGNTCIANSACCTNSDCPANQTCNTSTRQCQTISCPTNQVFCNGACVPGTCCTDANCSSGQYCDTSVNTCKQIFGLNLITNTASPQTVNSGSRISFGANPRNTGRDTLNNVILTFTKPDPSWTYAGVDSTNMANSCIENGNVVNCTFTSIMAGVAPLAKIGFNIPSSFSCNDNMTYSTQITGMSNEISSTSPLTLNANISCPPCPSDQKRCTPNSVCIPNTACCSNSDCQNGQTCNSSNQCESSCLSDQVFCNGTCVPGNCCTGIPIIPCPTFQTCNTATNTCEITSCPTGQRLCDGNCIPNNGCCRDSECQQGLICELSSNTCKPRLALEVISNSLLLNQEVNNGDLVTFMANARNIGAQRVPGVILSFTKPHSSWTFEAVDPDFLCTEDGNNRNKINCQLENIGPGGGLMVDVGFRVPRNFTCGNNATYTSNTSASGIGVFEVPGPALNVKVNCSCNTDTEILCNNSCVIGMCCINDECPTGQNCSTVAHTCSTCPSTQKMCNGRCISNSACCTSEECTDGKICNSSNQCTCPSDKKLCNNKCIPNASCCTNSNCTGGQWCDVTDNTCKPRYSLNITSMTNPAPKNRGTWVVLQANAINTGADGLSQTKVTFTKPDSSWTFGDIDDRYACVDSGNQVTCYLKYLAPSIGKLTKIALRVPENLSCNNTSYTTQVSGSSLTITTPVAGPSLTTNINCNCDIGQIQCNNTCVTGACCTNNDCLPGKTCNQSTRQCSP